MTDGESAPKAPLKRKKEPQEFVIRRTYDRDLKFRGWLVAESSSWNGMTPKPKRWKEWRLYETVGGKWVCDKAGLSNEPNEVERHEVEIVDPKGRGTGMAHVPARDAIKEFFGRDALAKELYDKAGIEDVEVIE